MALWSGLFLLLLGPAFLLPLSAGNATPRAQSELGALAGDFGRWVSEVFAPNGE